ncbi:TIGR04552 family protein [bacterium]|nr:TIGR04552 family protein [bacterium]
MIEKYFEAHQRKVRGHESAPQRQILLSGKGPSVMDSLEPVERVFLEGTSPVSLAQLSLRTEEEAEDFLRSYGVDPDSAVDRLKIQEIHAEAVDFLKRLICPAPRPCDTALALPAEMEDPSNITRFLVGASSLPQYQPLQVWACAVLRVMHAIVYANQVSAGPNSAEIRRQILDRFRSRVHSDRRGRLWLGQGWDAVPLCSIQYREEKARDSVILKLLHKPDNLPQSVHDRVGVRMVTPTKNEALAALQYIARHHLANVAHLTPGRSRNTLLTAEWQKSNPHSSPDFRSLQFTCRQLIRLDNPMYLAQKKMRKALQKNPCPELQAALAEIEAHSMAPQIRFLFPYEIQILDQENDLKTQVGESSHSNYRMRQLRAVRHRIFPANLLAP